MCSLKSSKVSAETVGLVYLFLVLFQKTGSGGKRLLMARCSRQGKERESQQALLLMQCP